MQAKFQHYHQGLQNLKGQHEAICNALAYERDGVQYEYNQLDDSLQSLSAKDKLGERLNQLSEP